MISIYTLALLVTTIDVIYGSATAFFVTKDFKSSTFKKGLLNHVFAIAVIVGSMEFSDLLAQYSIPVETLVGLFTASEFISMLETYVASGGKLPYQLEKYINNKVDK